MAGCTNPLGIRVKEPGEMRPARDARIQYVACGKCMACRLNHGRDWSTRIVHEASQHECSSFLTLTYSDEHLPDPPSVSRREMQLWIKRLRKELEPLRIRFFLCGEYGTRGKRPHYHAIIFGYDFAKDRIPWMVQNGNMTYRSPLLETTWPYGHCLIGDLTKQSAGYVARYAVKKASAYTKNNDEYLRLSATTGEFYRVAEEFLQMSTRPGIGFGWLEKYAHDLYPSGFAIVDGQRVPVPKAYNKKMARTEVDYASLGWKIDEQANRRQDFAEAHADDDTPERRAVKEELLQLRAQQLKRDLE